MPWVDAFDRETASRFPELEILQEESMAAPSGSAVRHGDSQGPGVRRS